MTKNSTFRRRALVLSNVSTQDVFGEIEGDRFALLLPGADAARRCSALVDGLHVAGAGCGLSFDGVDLSA